MELNLGVKLGGYMSPPLSQVGLGSSVFFADNGYGKSLLIELARPIKQGNSTKLNQRTIDHGNASQDAQIQLYFGIFSFKGDIAVNYIEIIEMSHYVWGILFDGRFYLNERNRTKDQVDNLVQEYWSQSFILKSQTKESSDKYIQKLIDLTFGKDYKYLILNDVVSLDVYKNVICFLLSEFSTNSIMKNILAEKITLKEYCDATSNQAEMMLYIKRHIMYDYLSYLANKDEKGFQEKVSSPVWQLYTDRIISRYINNEENLFNIVHSEQFSSDDSKTTANSTLCESSVKVE